MKKNISFLMLFLTIVSFSQSFTVNNINYEVASISSSTAKVVISTNATGNITIPESVAYEGVDYTITSIASRAFFGTSITSVTIPNTVTLIGGAAFENSTLVSVEIPDSVVSLGSTAFKLATALTTIKLSNSLTTLSAGIFDYTPSLKNITIPSSVTTIAFAAFRNSGIETITLEASTPPTFTGNAFEGVTLSMATLIVPDGTKATYENADTWKEFGTIQETSTLSSPSFNVKDHVHVFVNNQTLFVKNQNDIELLKLKIYNINGAEVHVNDIQANDISAMSRGIYVVKILTDMGVVSKKIIL